MKQRAKEFIKNPLISGSAVMFVGSITGNVFHFLFNLLTSRNLSVVDYGILISLISLTTLPALAFTALIPITVNFAAGYLAKNDYDKAKGLYLKMNKIMFFLGGVLLLVFLVFARVIAEFINLSGKELLIVPLGIIVLLGFMVMINMAFLQAKLAFRYVSFLTFLGGLLKFLAALGLIYFGYGVSGILIALIIGGIILYFAGLFPLKFIFHKGVKPVAITLKEILGYAAPATIALFCLTSFITTDILLVKHFFSESDAGLYAGLTLIGKVVFYFSSPIGMVMFPLAVKKYAKKQSHHKLLFASLLLVLIPSISLTFFYFMAPEFTINFFLKRQDYLAISDKIGLFGIYMTVYSLLSVLINFYLSIQKTKVYIPVLIAAITQIVLIFIFHSSLFQVIQISLTIASMLLCLLLIYYVRTMHFDKR